MSEIISNFIPWILSGLVTWGMIKNKADHASADIKELEQRIYEMREQFITRHEFNQTVTQMRADALEIRTDLKRVLEILSTR